MNLVKAFKVGKNLVSMIPMKCSCPGFESGPSLDCNKLCQFQDGLPSLPVQHGMLASEGRQGYTKKYVNPGENM
jgi:hypothetical protein